MFLGNCSKCGVKLSPFSVKTDKTEERITSAMEEWIETTNRTSLICPGCGAEEMSEETSSMRDI